MKAKWISAILIIVSLVLLNTIAAPVHAAVNFYEVHDGVVRYDKPSYTNIKGRLYEVQPGTNVIRYDKPSYIEKNGKLYEMNPGTNTIRYDKPYLEVK